MICNVTSIKPSVLAHLYVSQRNEAQINVHLAYQSSYKRRTKNHALALQSVYQRKERSVRVRYASQLMKLIPIKLSVQELNSVIEKDEEPVQIAFQCIKKIIIKTVFNPYAAKISELSTAHHAFRFIKLILTKISVLRLLPVIVKDAVAVQVASPWEKRTTSNSAPPPPSATGKKEACPAQVAFQNI